MFRVVPVSDACQSYKAILKSVKYKMEVRHSKGWCFYYKIFLQKTMKTLKYWTRIFSLEQGCGKQVDCYITFVKYELSLI